MFNLLPNWDASIVHLQGLAEILARCNGLLYLAEKTDEELEQIKREYAEYQEQQKQENKPRRLHIIDTTGWDDNAAQDPQFAEVADRVPTRQVTLFSGEGGAGKSILFDAIDGGDSAE